MRNPIESSPAKQLCGALDCRKAISSEIGDYEDAIMVETSIRSEMDCIVTRNVKDYMKSSVKVMNLLHY